MRPMKEFDAAKPATVHDRSFEWKPKTMQENYEKCATPRADGVIEWDGLLLDGWV